KGCLSGNSIRSPVFYAWRHNSDMGQGCGNTMTAVDGAETFFFAYFLIPLLLNDRFLYFLGKDLRLKRNRLTTMRPQGCKTQVWADYTENGLGTSATPFVLLRKHCILGRRGAGHLRLTEKQWTGAGEKNMQVYQSIPNTRAQGLWCYHNRCSSCGRARHP